MTALALGLPILSCCIAVYVVARRLPVDHVVRASVFLDRPPRSVWAALTDVGRYPAWRTGVSRVDRLADVDGRPAWCEIGPRGNRLPMRAADVVVGTTLTIVTVGDALPFSGTWSVSLRAQETGTLLTVQERTRIRSVMLRAVAHWLVGRDESIRLYAADLQRWARTSATDRDVALEA